MSATLVHISNEFVDVAGWKVDRVCSEVFKLNRYTWINSRSSIDLTSSGDFSGFNSTTQYLSSNLHENILATFTYSIHVVNVHPHRIQGDLQDHDEWAGIVVYRSSIP